MPSKKSSKVVAKREQSSQQKRRSLHNREKVSDDSDSNASDISPNVGKVSIVSTDQSYSRSPLITRSRRMGSSPQSDSTPSQHSNLYPDLSDLSSDVKDSNNSAYSDQDDSGRVLTYSSYRRSPQVESSRSGGQPKSTDKELSQVQLIYFICFICGLVILIIFYNWPSQVTVKESKVDDYEFFIKEINSLQRKFPNQGKRLWGTVIASSRHILKEPNSTYPSVIILASQFKNPHVSSCIAEKIASSFLKSRKVDETYIPATDIEDLKSVEPQKQKLLLDEDINKALQMSHGKAYIIKNLQSLSPEAALLLHGLCDGDNAPYKDVMILMTLEIQSGAPAMNANEAEDYLTNLWISPQVNYDKVSAVMSRIANNLVVLKQEEVGFIRKMCP